jgi:mannitol 2-dehydrogenase
MIPTPLSRATLREPANGVLVPAFEPAQVRAGIVHIGLGNFHRAHMAHYTHRLMDQQPEALEWGIVGAEIQAAGQGACAALAEQDGLYVLVERDDVQERVTIVGSLTRLIFAGEDSAGLLAAIDAPATRIVSLTITQHGYCLDPATKLLDAQHPAVRGDLDQPDRPRTAIGILVEAYRRRMAASRQAFTALSCDNIQHNGNVLRQAVLDFARLRDPALAEWIAQAARMPNTMVDRITPATRAADAADLTDRYGIVDQRPVFSETFTQWVIEDDFVDGRPDWGRVGAQFVADVTPYERMKLRLLNASHLAISGPARLMGYTFVDEAMRSPAVRLYMEQLMDRELEPTLEPVPGIDLASYKAALIDRFSNSTIKDTVERVNTDAALNYLLDPLRDRLRTGGSVSLLAFAVAAWLRRMRGEDEDGALIEIHHPLAAMLRDRAIEGGADPMPMLRIKSLFGYLADDPGFVLPVSRSLKLLYEQGAAAALEVMIHE